MKFNRAIQTQIYEDACEAVKIVHGVDLLTLQLDKDASLNHEIIKTLTRAVSGSTVMYYHGLLHNELLKHGIDIGPLEVYPSK